MLANPPVLFRSQDGTLIVLLTIIVLVLSACTKEPVTDANPAAGGGSSGKRNDISSPDATIT